LGRLLGQELCVQRVVIMGSKAEDLSVMGGGEKIRARPQYFSLFFPFLFPPLSLLFNARPFTTLRDQSECHLVTVVE
jgi:hypothetical protein